MTIKNLASVIKKSSIALAVVSLSMSTSLYAFETDEVEKAVEPIEYSISEESIITVPVMENALVFANLTDEMPAVVNYFTSEEEDVIIRFYQNIYGEIISRVDVYGRLTLTFVKDENTIRVAITQQNQKRQVDIIVEEIKNVEDTAIVVENEVEETTTTE